MHKLLFRNTILCIRNHKVHRVYDICPSCSSTLFRLAFRHVKVEHTPTEPAKLLVCYCFANDKFSHGTDVRGNVHLTEAHIMSTRKKRTTKSSALQRELRKGETNITEPETVK